LGGVGVDSVVAAPEGCEVVGWFRRAEVYGPLGPFGKAVSIGGLVVCETGRCDGGEGRGLFRGWGLLIGRG
jgi:hypothetical protein